MKQQLYMVQKQLETLLSLSEDHNAKEDFARDISVLNDERNSLILQSVHVQREIQSVILMLPCEERQRILTMYFVDLKSPKRIASELFYSANGVYWHIEKGIKEVDKIVRETDDGT